MPSNPVTDEEEEDASKLDAENEAIDLHIKKTKDKM